MHRGQFVAVVDCLVVVDGMATVCYCSVCPSGNTSCELKPNGQCFAAVELDHNEWVLSHGCLAPVDEEGGIILQVSSASAPVTHSVAKQLQLTRTTNMFLIP